MGSKPDWLVVDHYALDRRWERALRTRVGRILVVDDLADRPHDCDLLLDQNFDPLLLDSNGAGGYHLLLIFSEPVPTAEIFASIAACPRAFRACLNRGARLLLDSVRAALHASGRSPHGDG